MKKMYKGLLLIIASIGLLLGTGVSAQTPVLLKVPPAGDYFSRFTVTPNGLYFKSNNLLWRTDGTPEGTQPVKNSSGQFVTGFGSFLAVVNGRLYFDTNTLPGTALYYIDNSGVAQTIGLYSGGISNLGAADNQIYFSISDDNGNQTIWETYGDGTKAVSITTVKPMGSGFPLTFYRGQLYYLTAKSSPSNVESFNNVTLWRLSGSPATAVQVKDLPLYSDGGQRLLQVANDRLYIGGVDNTSPHLANLYQSDGTPTGTTLLQNPPGLSTTTDAYQTKIANSQLYLVGYSNSILRGPTGGLYKVNSANNSIEEAKDVYGQLPVGVRLFRSSEFIYYKGLFYFSATYNDSSNPNYKGGELWRSDGTLVKDIQAGPGTSDPQNFYVYNDVLYFTAEDNVYRKLYRTDGTTAGTQPFTTLAAGTGISSSLASNLTGYKNELYLTASSTATGYGLWKIQNDTPVPPMTTTSLILTTPTYDCATGLLSLSTTGGNGTPVEYRIAGLRDFSASPTFTVPAYQRNGTTFTLEARQSGQTVSAPFLTACQSTTTTPPTSPTQPTGTGLTLTTPAYDCNAGQLTLSTSGGNGQPIDFRIAGLRDYATSPTFLVPAYQRMGTSFTLEARQSGVVVTLPFTSACQSTTTTPPTSPTQPTGTTLSVSAQPLNCQTGALQLLTTGGDGTPIDFKVPGLRDYGSSALFTVPAYQRSNTTFTLYARQNGREVTGTYAATCPVSGRLASAEASGEFRVVVYPNPVGEQFSVGVSGASGQLVRFHLTNLSGQTVVEQRAQVSSDAHSEMLRLPASGAGLYLLQVSTDNQSKTVKVLKP